MTEQQEETKGPRTSIGLTWPVRERLAAFEFALMMKEGRRDMTANIAVERLLDYADAADLP